jgi:hypothetical protein
VVRKRFETEKLGNYPGNIGFPICSPKPVAPEDIEMEDLNYYYANYSR